MARDLEFDGKPKLNRTRQVVEEGYVRDRSVITDLPVPKESLIDRRKEAVDKIFTSLSKTLIKSDIVKNGLALMDPAQEIPVDESDQQTRASARRFDRDQSRDGSVITYSMYQSAVDETLNINWNLRTKFLSVAPTTVYENNNSVSTTKSKSGIENLIKEFFEENGVAGSIISLLTLSPFQSIVFQALTPAESGAKTVQTVQVISGIAILIELGIKAEMILNFLKKSNLNIALTERQVVELENDQAARSAALASVGIEYEDLKNSMKQKDSETIIEYVSQYYTRYGGLVSPNNHLTLDHWIGYLDVSKNRHLLRSAVNTADNFSQKFRDIRNPTADTGIVSQPELRPVSAHIDLASTLKHLDGYSNSMLEDVINAFSHQLSDKALCCMTEIFGHPGRNNLEVLRTISYILRILATDLSANIVQLDNIARRFLARKLQSAIFEIVTQLNSVYDKIQSKLSEAFTLKLPGLESCGGMFTIGVAIAHSIEIIYKQISFLMRDITSVISDYGEINKGSWKVAAERRELLGIAKVLETIADRLDLVEACSKNRSRDKFSSTNEVIDGIKEEAARNIMSEFLEKSPPSIQITDEQYTKYFPDLRIARSEKLGFNFGVSKIKQERTEETGCQELGPEELDNMGENFWKNIEEVFKNG